MNISALLKTASTFVSKNSPAILTSTAVLGVITTTVLAVRGTVPALRDIQEAESMQTEPLTPANKLELAWPYFVPAAAVGGATIACIIGSHTLSSRRNAALVTAYTLTEKAFKDYKGAVVKQLSKKDVEKVEEEYITKRMEESSPHNLVILKGREQLCYEVLTGKFWVCDPEDIKRAVNDLNHKMLSGSEYGIDMNEFYSRVGLAPTPMGERLGWNVDALLDVQYSSYLDPTTNQVALAISYNNPPFPNAWDLNR